MSLDQNLFTLIFTPNKDHPNVTDLVDPSETIHYHKRRVPGQEYKIEVYDPLSESLLITATAPSASSKVKVLELYNPTTVVELKSTGTLSFRWSFKWEEHEFEWKREQCFLIRKPDPPVLVAVTKEQSRQLKNPQVQILDYNIQRFDIDDRKGLEIVILTALMTFHDMSDNVSSPVAEQPPTALQAPPPSISRRVSSLVSFNNEAPPPPTPPKPAPRTGLDRIRELQEMKGEDYNEITVEDEGTVEDYAQYCSDLLSDDAMLFISVKSSAAEFVPKVLQVVEETKRIRYKAGMDDEAELHQYVLYDTEKKKGPKRINLNDDAKQKAKYAPPESLTVHLSKIDMPELAPKSQGTVNRGKDNKASTGSAPSSSTASSAQPPSKPRKRTPSPPASSPATPSGSSSFWGSRNKQPKNKLTKQSKERPTSTPPPAASTPPPPPTGIFNSQPPPPPPPSFPMPYGGDYKAPQHPPVQHPPPPPPQHYQQQPYGQGSSSGSGSNRPLSTVGGIAESVVSGLFGMVKNASNQVRK